MALVLDVFSWLLLLAGGAFVVIGAYGMLRLPDFYSRLHPAGLTDTLGAGLILFGLLLQAEAVLVAVKLVIIAVLLAITSPTSSHATALAALSAGVQPWRKPGTNPSRNDEGDKAGVE